METSVCSYPSKCITTTDNLSVVLEQFIRYHTCYQWDKAKEFVEHERDLFRTTFPTLSGSILMQLFTCLLQLITADKNYMLLQFFSTKVFHRKDTVKSAYENLRFELRRLGQLGQIRSISELGYSDGSRTPRRNDDGAEESADEEKLTRTVVSPIESEKAIDVLNCDITQMYSRRVRHSAGDEEDRHSIGSSASSTLSGSTPTSPKGTPQNRSILSKLFRSFSKSNQNPELVSV